MKIIFSYFLLFFILLNSSNAQQSQLGQLDANPSPLLMSSSAGVYIKSFTSAGIEKLFLFDEFNNKAVIFDSNNKQYKIANFNIDLTTNEFVSEFKKDSVFAFQNINKAIINNQTFVKDNSGVFEVISEGKKIDLKIKYFAVEKDIVRDKLNGKILKPKHFVLKKEYILSDKVNNKSYNLKRLKKKIIFSSFDKQYKDQVIQFIKKNELSLKEKIDLKSIYNYYNSL